MKLKELPESLNSTLGLLKVPTSRLTNLKSEIPLIVSLTTIESRLNKVHITIRSLLTQKQLPHKILLWINHNDKNKIPKRLCKLESDIFEIHFTELHCSHKKLIHTLELYPNSPIITCDDDLIYSDNWIEKTYKEHLKHPLKIIGNQTRIISYNNNELLPYKQWKHSTNLNSYNKDLVLPIGANGILYPVNSLHKEVQNISTFLKLTPKADDLWFKAMALLQNTTSIQSTILPSKPIPVAGTQKVSLKKQNVRKDQNRTQWLALTDYYGLTI